MCVYVCVVYVCLFWSSCAVRIKSAPKSSTFHQGAALGRLYSCLFKLPKGEYESFEGCLVVNWSHKGTLSSYSLGSNSPSTRQPSKHCPLKGRKLRAAMQERWPQSLQAVSLEKKCGRWYPSESGRKPADAKWPFQCLRWSRNFGIRGQKSRPQLASKLKNGCAQ